ncbi:MAG: Uma2 family endonuclease [Chloroflexaceae bacterium]|nr:Uma2 family endonuclease [Chloroflexaceae bacterium]
MSRLTDVRLEGPADLVVEVVSPESVQRDQERKYSEYAQYGVNEYWLVDPRPGKQTLTVYQRNAAGQYEGAAPDGQGRFHSAVLGGFWVDGGWLWQEPLPSVLQCWAAVQATLAAGEA